MPVMRIDTTTGTEVSNSTPTDPGSSVARFAGVSAEMAFCRSFETH